MIESDVQSIIDELGVVLFFNQFDKPGYYIPPWNAIFINRNLDEQQQRVVLLHELGHAAKQRGQACLYKRTMNMKLKMEYGANRFMIQYLFTRYINTTDVEPTFVNYLEFMRQNDIPSRDEELVKDIILNN